MTRLLVELKGLCLQSVAVLLVLLDILVKIGCLQESCNYPIGVLHEIAKAAARIKVAFSYLLELLSAEARSDLLRQSRLGLCESITLF